ncbi:uncharacterized protein MYCGRDRAFT_108406 [Zymoseptoria tritici IPO323]|uniref:Uncharacterized protein n=1 Tax=Zymoseptoria tritici (strain CBS 115943 / IPO323) TaxID=336722 RepID=F9X5G2_ZYMTI|nr:uncharacterized protein MYCGRDRAFT_108406 [Zymoseptoria tritici IPO323]EGP88610.1 hypothetical protein MYCGRDRAFT_108406 [Zymoseptoria tritici IPO323]
MFTTSSAGKKRSRVDDDETTLQSFSSPLEKRSRPTANASGAPSPWLHRYHDSVLSTPTLSRSSTLGIPRSPPKYDSEDDENSSEISEPVAVSLAPAKRPAFPHPSSLCVRNPPPPPVQAE